MMIPLHNNYYSNSSSIQVNNILNNKKRRYPQRHLRRGSILILVVGVLVLLMISATVYVRVGRLERISAGAGEMESTRSDTINKVVDHIGHILAYDLFGNDIAYNDQGDKITALHPFEDLINPYNPSSEIIGERWDSPYTRPGDEFEFNVLADPWLASSEPGDYDDDGTLDRWPHISNIHPEGKFSDLGKLFEGGDGNNFYGNIFLRGANTDPYDLDTYTQAINVSVQIDDYDTQSSGYPTFADRQYGDDTDMDGYLDARWTELPGVYGVPDGMRVFTAVRIVDLSSMLNLNANIESGLSSDSGPASTIGYGRTPADIDLYSFLLDAFVPKGSDLSSRPQHEIIFNNDGFRQHLARTGILDRYDININSYSPSSRIPRAKRDSMYNEVGKYSYGQVRLARPYDASDEIELRTFFSTSNSGSTSRVEQNFTKLNQNDYISPFRDQEFNELDYSNNRPTITDLYGRNAGAAGYIPGDSRHLLTTYNGSRSALSWNISESSHAFLDKLNIDQLLSDNAVDFQSVTGAVFWALAPYAVQRSESDARNPIYNTPTYWSPPSNYELHYGDSDAGFAYLRSAMLAVNTKDYFDYNAANDPPSVRTLRFEPIEISTGLNPKIEIGGVFEHGRIPTTLFGISGANQYQKKITLIGLERQPFFREISTMIVYYDHDINDGNKVIDFENDQDRYADLVAFELGNPWDTDLDISKYEIRFAGVTFNLTDVQTKIPAGGAIVLIYGPGDSPVGPGVTEHWKTEIDGRTSGSADVDTKVIILPGSYSVKLLDEHEEAQLWRKDVTYGTQTDKKVLVDRIRASDLDNQLADFPAIEIGQWRYGVANITNPPQNEGAFWVDTSSMRRYCDTPDGGAQKSFPAYVFQSPDNIKTKGIQSYKWQKEIPNAIIPPEDLITQIETANKLADYHNRAEDKDYGVGDQIKFAPFQLLVPNLDKDNDENFRSPVDLLMVTSVTHMNFDQSTDVTFTDPDKYITISEYLGDENLAQRQVYKSAMGVEQALTDITRPTDKNTNSYPMPDFRTVTDENTENPFVGKLDYTRYIPHDSSGKALIHQAIPLAARVIDAFDSMVPDSTSPLIQGRININTAPMRVIQALPYLNPDYNAGPIPQRNPNLLLTQSILAYRDQKKVKGGTGGIGYGLDWSNGRWNASKLYTTDDTANSGLRDDYNKNVGFTSLSELSLITKWQTIGTNIYSYTHKPPDYTDSVIRNQSLTIAGHDNQNLTFDPMNYNPNAKSNYDPVDDVSEWNALSRVISNSIAVRSDVYVAYISLVGITSSDIVRAVNDSNKYGLSELEMLKPTMYQRYMVVFDRSNVQSASDKPRVLFSVKEVPNR